MPSEQKGAYGGHLASYVQTFPLVSGFASAFAPDAITVRIKAMGVGREDPKVPVGDVDAIKVRRWRGYTHVGIGGVAIPGWRGWRG